MDPPRGVHARDRAKWVIAQRGWSIYKSSVTRVGNPFYEACVRVSLRSLHPPTSIHRIGKFLLFSKSFFFKISSRNFLIVDLIGMLSFFIIYKSINFSFPKEHRFWNRFSKEFEITWERERTRNSMFAHAYTVFRIYIYSRARAIMLNTMVW